MSQTSSFELHVAQTATRSPKLFLYTHYQDQGHAPFLTVTPPSDNDPYIVLECRDTFKFKPNLQGAAKNRIDLYYYTYEECIQFGVRDCTVYILD